MYVNSAINDNVLSKKYDKKKEEHAHKRKDWVDTRRTTEKTLKNCDLVVKIL